jgi:hypothetical protein
MQGFEHVSAIGILQSLDADGKGWVDVKAPAASFWMCPNHRVDRLWKIHVRGIRIRFIRRIPVRTAV